MTIQKILWQANVAIEENIYDVLIPLPANPDECLKNIGIDDFDDTDDGWDEDFNTIVKLLVHDNNYRIKTYNPTTKETEYIKDGNISSIQEYLANYDHINFIIEMANREVIFTCGHEIFWLKNFSKEIIHSLGFKLESIQNDKMKNLF